MRKVYVVLNLTIVLILIGAVSFFVVQEKQVITDVMEYRRGVEIERNKDIAVNSIGEIPEKIEWCIVEDIGVWEEEREYWKEIKKVEELSNNVDPNKIIEYGEEEEKSEEREIHYDFEREGSGVDTEGVYKKGNSVYIDIEELQEDKDIEVYYRGCRFTVRYEDVSAIASTKKMRYNSSRYKLEEIRLKGVGNYICIYADGSFQRIEIERKGLKFWGIEKVKILS